MVRDAGIRGSPIILHVSDEHIMEKDMLADLQGLVSSGRVPDLFPESPKTVEEQTEMANLFTELRAILTSAHGEAFLCDVPNADLYAFFFDRVRRHVHVALSVTYAGRVDDWLSEFPVLTSSFAKDFYSPWSHQDLIAFAAKTLADVSFISPGEECVLPDSHTPRPRETCCRD